MSIENGPRYETFAAPRTNVRTFASVISLVNDQRGPLRKRFSTLITGVLALARVGYIVCPQQGLTGKALAADFAGIRLLTSVGPVVDLEALRCFQLLPTEGAQISAPLVIRRVAVSLHLMLLQHRLVLVHLPTDVALVLGLIRLCQGRVEVVQSVVFLQRVYVVEGAPAGVALLVLHEVVHGRMRYKGGLVEEGFAADLAGELEFPVYSLLVPLDVRRGDSHEAALGAGHCFRRV